MNKRITEEKLKRINESLWTEGSEDCDCRWDMQALLISEKAAWEEVERLREIAEPAQFWKEAAETQKQNNLAILKEVERLKEEAKEKNEAIEELHNRASHYAAVRDNAVKVGYKQAQQLQDALNTLDTIVDYGDGYSVDMAMAAIQRIQERNGHGE